MTKTLVVLLGAAGALVWWATMSLRRKTDKDFTQLYSKILSSDEYTVKGRFDE